MKVGIITICKVNNYGAELQAFATQKFIEQLGFDAEIIDYTYYKNWNFKDTERSKPFIPLSLKGKLMYWLKYRCINWIVANLLPIFYGTEKRRKSRYANFHSLMKFSSQYLSMEQLYTNPPLYDIYITGSDQVWNPTTSSSIEPYFLTFAPLEKKKISYASSFGVSQLNGTIQERYKVLLNNFDKIAVREQEAITIVKELCRKEVELVIDPTLLFDFNDWKLYMKDYPNMPSKYILIYQLSHSPKLIEQARVLGKELGCNIYSICKRSYKNEENTGITKIKDAGPQEFLSLMSNASYIVTNSFHGTAFAVNFKKPFYVVLSRKKSNNSRIESLLRRLDLLKNIIYEDTPIGSVEQHINNYDNELNKFRSFSREYLKRNIL